jgi:hypothetical protein
VALRSFRRLLWQIAASTVSQLKQLADFCRYLDFNRLLAYDYIITPPFDATAAFCRQYQPSLRLSLNFWIDFTATIDVNRSVQYSTNVVQDSVGNIADKWHVKKFDCRPAVPPLLAAGAVLVTVSFFSGKDHFKGRNQFTRSSYRSRSNYRSQV